NEENPGYQQIIADITAMGEADKLRRSVVFPAGRANRKARYFRYQTAPEPTVSACSMASSPVIFPDGKVMACIGPLLTLAVDHPLVLGNLQHESLATVLDRAEVNPILHMIRVWGPYKLVSLLQQRGFGALLPEEYICNSICDVCYQLMTNEQLVRALHQLADDEEIQKLVAYARLYYLHEPTMVEFCTANHVMPQQL
ncbi:MAG: hypothetical protein KDE19_18045, partial [Caldilineaceae bacterium]|nr:hypothetical protein [Caldilineaceae bacterium]